MSDSDKTNELDDYGVWVKKPAHTVSSESEDMTADFLSDSSDTASSGETEISLDEFIEGGVFEGDDGGSAASEASELANKASDSSSEESVSVDDFLGDSEPGESSDITISDSPMEVSASPAAQDDGPLDIDLSFDDDSGSVSSSSSLSSAPVEEVAGSEEVDLSDFGVDFGDDSSSNGSTESVSGTVNDDGSENIDLSDFGFDINAPESSGEEESPKAEESSETVVNDDGTENVDLSDFGFDINAPESSGESSESTESTSEQASAQSDDDSVPSLSDNEPSSSEEDTMTVTVDDDEHISLEGDSSPQTQEASSQTQDFSAPDDDDFDLDSIMDSIEDENGNTSSLVDTPVESVEVESSEPEVTEPEKETIDVVDMEEPVFEETAVDIPDTEATESENPFALPPDDAFAAPSPIEEQTISNATDATIDDSTITDESVAEEAEEEPAPEEPAIEEENTEEIVINEPLSEPAAVSEAEVVKQDAEISQATNNILSQIAAELSSLRGEISTLKSEFEEIKNRPVPPAQNEAVSKPSVQETTTAEEDAFLSQEPTETESSGGFFGNDDEDDTIALSLDEMDDILSSVDIIEEASEQESEQPTTEEAEPAEAIEDVADESLDFSDDAVEEPALDEIDTNIADEDEELPEEISIPKTDETDDILVESSSENLISESENIAGSEELSEELTIDDEPFVFGDEEASDTDENEFTVEPALEDSTLSADELAGISADSQDESEDSTLSADELAGIASDSQDESEDSTLSADELANITGEADDKSDLLADIMGDVSESETNEETSGISISEGELDTLLTNEAAREEELKNATEEENSTPKVTSSIPGDLQTEIKSVLAYMDQLLENLPEEKIAEFAQSEQFETYKKLFKELGLD